MFAAVGGGSSSVMETDFVTLGASMPPDALISIV